jgi:hypothetical protein
MFPNWEIIPSNRRVSILLEDIPIENSKKILKLSDTFSQSSSYFVPTIISSSLLGSDIFPVTFLVSINAQSSLSCNHQLCIVGAFQEWKLDDADPLVITRPSHGNSRFVGYKTIFLQAHQFPFEYKYVLKSKNNLGVLWEGYGNRLIHNSESAILVQDDGYFRVKYGKNPEIYL